MLQAKSIPRFDRLRSSYILICTIRILVTMRHDLTMSFFFPFSLRVHHRNWKITPHIYSKITTPLYLVLLFYMKEGTYARPILNTFRYPCHPSVGPRPSPWPLSGTCSTVHPCYNGPRYRYTGSLAIPDEPGASRFHTSKLPLAIPDGHTIPYWTECKGFHIPVLIHFSLAITDGA